MKLIGIIHEDFVNYKKPSMVLEFPYCNFKCDRECRLQVCQNSELAYAPKVEVTPQYIVKSYLSNPITEALVLQGLEPLDGRTYRDVYQIVSLLRKEGCYDDIVIYTGYTEDEVELQTRYLRAYGKKNIIIKYGRFKPGNKPHYDETLGVYLASDNQYGKKIC